MKRYLLSSLLIVLLSATALADDYAKIRTISSRGPQGRVVEIKVGPTFHPGAGKVIPACFQKLKELKKSGRMEYAWPDASSITLEVSYKGETLKATCNPKLLSRNLNDEKKKTFYRLWSEAHKLLWDVLEKEAKGG